MKTRTIIMTLVSFIFTLSFAQTNLVMENNSIWPEDFSEEDSYQNLTLGNSSILNVSNNLIIIEHLYGNNNNVINITGSLVVEGDIIFNNNSNVTIDGNITSKGNVFFSQNTNVNINGVIDIQGDLTIGDNSSISGTGTINIDGNNNISSDALIESSVTINSEVLPIELLSFSYTTKANEVLLNWSTASEVNNDFFTIEKSLDFANWEEVALLPGAGNSNTINNYSYSVNKENQVTYYRLKQTDFDGKYEYVGTIEISLKNTDIKEISLLSVSTKNGKTSAIMHSTSNQAINLRVYRMDGALIIDTKINLIAGTNAYSMPQYAASGILITEISNNYHRSSIKQLNNN